MSSSMHTSNDMTLVLGGTGKTGRRIAERLRARGRPARVGSRSGAPAFDWEDRGEEEAQRPEQAVQASGAEWTIVRCSWFMQNFSEGILRDPILQGQLALPVGEVGEPFIDAEDIADVLLCEVLDGRNAHLSDGVQRALGRQPRDFAQFARHAAATGAWGTP